jgi:FkbM family methyltransferase
MSSEKIKLVGPLDALHVYFLECENGVYDYDYNNKVVLDVGGFCGETAVFFSSRGAKKIIIYEPVLAHHELIRKNMALNGIEAELHEEGIGEKDESKIISYESANCAFGSLSAGKNRLKVKLKSVTKVIEESRADVGKFDCEGAEVSLVKVPKEILRNITFYMIETHRPEIRRAIMEKFSRVGFKSARSPVDLAKDISVLYFEKLP